MQSGNELLTELRGKYGERTAALEQRDLKAKSQVSRLWLQSTRIFSCPSCHLLSCQLDFCRRSLVDCTYTAPDLPGCFADGFCSNRLQRKPCLPVFCA
ncbi:Hypothetical predicted protein [Podarcis lilfordi]|uniref:Uncharacterized protein n=1 Tax=Podarcis lilfordi TaxID=74358 RepID=A0AA35KKH3_9SAUR|nr:Hypothetical predicted protein [Podarcis lilfordi]